MYNRNSFNIEYIMTEKKFTNELKQTFEYIQNHLLKEYDCDKISTEYFILSVLENENSIGNKILSKVMLYDSMENAKVHYYQWLSQNAKSFGGTKEYDDVFEKSIKNAKTLAIQQKSKTINSGHVLLSIFNFNNNVGRYFKSLGVTVGQISTQVIEETNNIIEEERKNAENSFVKGTPVKHTHKPKTQANTRNETQNISDNDIIVAAVAQQLSRGTIGECEKLFTNLNKEALNCQIEKICGNEEIYTQIYNILTKRNKNNVAIVGKSGVGKTDTVRYLASLIVNGSVPKTFIDKILLEIDFNTLFAGTGMQGAFETKMKSIIADAKQRGNYIFFIDSLSGSLKNKYNNTYVENFIEAVMKEKNIMMICTCSEKDYTSAISDYPEWERYFERINMEEPSEEKCIEILNQHAEKLAYFHNVTYNDNVIERCMKLCKKYITERNLPDSAIDILDRVGAKKSLEEVESENIIIARNKLSKIKKEKEALKHSASTRDYKQINKLEKEEIELQTLLDCAIKSHNLEKQPLVINEDDIKECISEKTHIPLDNLTEDDREKLKDLNERIKNIVIGQNEAVDNVCKAIKRQRMGLSNPNKPVVFLMAGSTGVGKTYLAKTIAKEVFGDEKKMVRLDMGEYSDSMGASTLLGSGKGFVGYDSGGILTEAIKNNKHCVLLLDEIEKADEKVHNLFLSVFDEGRLMDNKGVTVDFKNVIVIMTSNIGAKEVDERGNGIGFVRNTEEIKKEIIEKEIKRKFKPEFINRIDKIVYFNKLTDQNLQDIIKLEINKLRKRLEDIGYGLEENIENTKIFDVIFNNIKENKNQGARPIIREIQRQMEDKITDLLIDKFLEKGYVFKGTDLMD